MRRLLLLGLTAMFAAGFPPPSAVGAQGRGALPPGRRLQQLGGVAGTGQDSGLSREELQRRLRQATAIMAQQRLGLTDDQMRKLGPVNKKYEQERQAIAKEEQQTRQALRREMQGSSSPDQEEISRGMQHLIDLQHRRVDLVEAEQKELSAFLTPLQRVKYHALQEQIRQRAQQLRRQQMQGARQGHGTDPFGTAPDSLRRRPTIP